MSETTNLVEPTLEELMQRVTTTTANLIEVIVRSSPPRATIRQCKLILDALQVGHWAVVENQLRKMRFSAAHILAAHPILQYRAVSASHRAAKTVVEIMEF